MHRPRRGSVDFVPVLLLLLLLQFFMHLHVRCVHVLSDRAAITQIIQFLAEAELSVCRTRHRAQAVQFSLKHKTFPLDLILAKRAVIGSFSLMLRALHHLLSSQAAMDHVLHIADCYFFTPYIYPVSWPESWAVRQIISLWVVTNVGALLVYLVFGALNFYYVFDHVLMKHPQFIEVGR